jgi:UDP-N-acetyl-D-glucosamine dehydrogenase
MSVPGVASSFASAIAARQTRIGIVGLGYAGLPLAVSFADEGFDVVGIDVSAQRVDAVNERRSYIDDVPGERYEVAGRLSADDGLRRPGRHRRAHDLRADAAVEDPVAGHLEHHRGGRVDRLAPAARPARRPAVDDVSRHHEEIVLPILERSGLRVGSDIFLGYAPERIDPGSKRWSLRATPSSSRASRRSAADGRRRSTARWSTRSSP